LLAALVILLIICLTDGNSLNVDRWSAMHVAIKAWLNGEYPYTAVDHLHGRTSNFPGLLVLGIPFYILGNVGYLEVFAFLLLAYMLNQYLPIKQSISYMVLLLLSPAYWWEIFAISDLFSNIIIVVCLIILLKKHTRDQPFNSPYFLGICTGFLFLTRGIVAIPLTLFLFKDFWRIPPVVKFKFIVAFLTTIALLIFSVLIYCPNLNTLKFYNPLVLQTNYLPHYIHIIALSLPFLFAFKIKDFGFDFFKYATILLLLPVIFSFIYRGFLYGVNLDFDLSYFSMALPFALVCIVQQYKVKPL